MSATLSQKEIINHATKDEHNFRVAMEVVRAFPELCKQVIHDFSQKFKSTLEKPGYKVDTSRWENSPTGSNTGMTYQQDSWPPDIAIRIEAQQSGIHNYVIGVNGRKDKIDCQVREKIYTALNSKIMGGKQTEWYIWYEDLKGDYKNFDNPQTLIALYKIANDQQTEMLDYLTNRIREIEQIVREALTEEKRTP